MPGGRVLFVDDEPEVLAGLRRDLRALRIGWAADFVLDGEEALRMMSTAPYDVVVTDLRMPAMNGVQLLLEARRRHPGTARMVLSSEADRGMLSDALGPTHRFLDKAEPTEKVLDAVERVLELRERLTSPVLRSVLGTADTLPKPPALHLELNEVLARPDCTVADIAAVVETDMALTSELLRLVNSAYFGMPSPVLSVSHATRLLGAEVIHGLSLAGKLFGPSAPAGPVDLEVVRERALTSARLARSVATLEGWSREAVNVVFLSSLLHDVGLLALAVQSPAVLQAWTSRLRVNAETETPEASAMATIGCTLPQASAYLLGIWGFPASVIDALEDQDQQAHPVLLAGQLVGFARRCAEGRPATDLVHDPVVAGRWSTAVEGLLDLAH